MNLLHKLIVVIFLCPLMLHGGCWVDSKWCRYNHMEIGPEFSHVKIDNDANPLGDSDGASGNLWGVTGSYEYREPCYVYVNLNATWLENKISGGENRRKFSDLRLEALIGYSFQARFFPQWTLTPFIGFGYEEITQSHIQPDSITIKTPFYYVPVGLLMMFEICDCFQAGCNFKWNPQVNSFYKNSALRHKCWKLENKDGFVVELPLTFCSKGCIEGTVSLIPYWRQITKGNGTANTRNHTHVKIPEQQYDFYGVKLTFGMNF